MFACLKVRFPVLSLANSHANLNANLSSFPISGTSLSVLLWAPSHPHHSSLQVSVWGPSPIPRPELPGGVGEGATGLQHLAGAWPAQRPV